MDKQNILKHIKRWLDIRQKNGYKNARIGFKGMEEPVTGGAVLPIIPF